MNVSLTDELERWIEGRVETGLYRSSSEVVREALRLLAEQDRLREAHGAKLRAALAEGLTQADRGETVDGPEFLAGVRQGLGNKAKTEPDGR